MKKAISILFVGLFFCTLIACVFTIDSSDHKTEESGKEYTSAYICPMHCKGSGADSMAICPVCSMDYVKNDDSHSH